MVRDKSCILVFEDEWLASNLLQKYENRISHYFIVVWTDHMRKRTSHIFANHISGLRDGKRSIHFIRNYLKRSPKLLTLPVILIASHVRSLHGGCFDYTINPDTLNRAVPRSLFCDGPQLDDDWWVEGMLDTIVGYCDDWFKP